MKLSNSSNAVAWLLADKNRTQQQAAGMFCITQGAISATLTRERQAIEVMSRLGADTVRKAVAHIEARPDHTIGGAARTVGRSIQEVRTAVMAHYVLQNRAKYSGQAAALDPVHQERERCAILAEAMGGNGPLIASVIRAV